MTRQSNYSPKRRHIWRHNQFFGFARMIEMQSQNIISSESATDDAKFLAKIINNAARALRIALKTRIDPWKEEQ